MNLNGKRESEVGMSLERSRNGEITKPRKYVDERRVPCAFKRRIPIVLLIIILLTNICLCICTKGNLDFAIEINIFSTHF